MKRPRLSHMHIPVSGHERIRLTPEQEQQREKEMEEQEKEQEEWDNYQSGLQAERLAKQVKYVLDQAYQHPFVKQLISIREPQGIQLQILQMALPAVITANPKATAQEIADKALDIAGILAMKFQK